MLDPEAGPECQPFRRFNASQSSTFNPSDSFREVQYEGLWGRGYLARDNFCISSLCTNNQTFANAEWWRTQYGNNWAPLDTGLGLARFRPRDPRSQEDVSAWGNTPLQNMIQQ